MQLMNKFEPIKLYDYILETSHESFHEILVHLNI